MTARIGVIGCGNVAPAYVRNGARFRSFEIVACADADETRARSLAAVSPGVEPLPVESLLASPDIDVILNLTPPAAHADIGERALRAGKHLYQEKPLATDLARARSLAALATGSRLRLGCAPDTFLGDGLQAARRAIDAGLIGAPVAATACMAYAGPDLWHPEPEFFFQHGAGPLLDMGPYYVTALVQMLGPVARVSAATRVSRPWREIHSGPRRGAQFPVTTPTHVTSILEFASGALATMVMSFDLQAHRLPVLEIYGDDATLLLPDPNTFAGPLWLKRRDSEPESMPVDGDFADNARGVGLADMCEATESNRPHRASPGLALHVLEVLSACLHAAEAGRRVAIESSCSRADPLAPGESL
ncbi:MAG: Gfo/Idh/MocA family oxidoreductase [Phycisphaeraceae bacterium]|nr:Gfo/Idh/MocA family oxidoreductase [Phycisphaeraceae bacterium]